MTCSIYDSKVKAFMRPFFVRARGEATRLFDKQVNENGNPVHDYPEDFSLMVLGTYNEETGQFENLDAPENLGLGSHYKRES